MKSSSIDFDNINRAALVALPILVRRWAPDGRRRGCEWVALNPTRNDHSPGSFKINLRTGHWAEFADDAPAKGRDVTSLFAYLRNIRQGEAARELAELLRVQT
jgi:hypothetical protein